MKMTKMAKYRNENERKRDINMKMKKSKEVSCEEEIIWNNDNDNEMAKEGNNMKWCNEMKW